jgi:hypothetical protein
MCLSSAALTFSLRKAVQPRDYRSRCFVDDIARETAFVQQRAYRIEGIRGLTAQGIECLPALKAGQGGCTCQVGSGAQNDDYLLSTGIRWRQPAKYCLGILGSFSFVIDFGPTVGACRPH